MNIDLRALLKTLDPVTLQEHLRSRGWSADEDARSTQALTYRRGGDELDVPLRADLADYGRRVEELVGLLAALDGVSPTSLLDDLLEPRGDTLAVRIDSPLTASGTIPLDESIRIRQGMRSLVLAAAHSATSPQAWYARLTQRDPIALLSTIREGQSQRGSFTMRCIVPVAPLPGDQLVMATEEPYGRRVTALLLGALSSVERVRARGDREGLLSLAGQGVSGNLLAALGDMAPPGQVGALEISVAWARSLPAPRDVVQRVRLPSAAFDGLREAGAAMRDRVKSRGFEVAGYVTHLAQAVDRQGQGGEITLAPTGEARELGTLSVSLAQDAYDRAVLAHHASAQVQVIGTLEKIGRKWVLSEPSGFERCGEAIPDQDGELP